MFVHAPADVSVQLQTLIVWDHPDLAYHAVEICSQVEHRVREVRFRIIQESEVKDLRQEASAEALCEKACCADLILLAVEESIGQSSQLLQGWIQALAAKRQREEGGLAVLRGLRHVDEKRAQEWVRDFERGRLEIPASEEEFHRFLEQQARKARLDLLWQPGLSELSEAVRSLRYLPSLCQKPAGE